MKILQVCGVALLMALALFLAMGLVVLGNNIVGKREVVINCTLAEISPDIPVEAKEACRKLRMEKSNGN